MIHQNHMRCRTTTSRGGFTLVELLVVIVIGLIITAITAAAATRMIAAQKLSNSRQTVEKVGRALQRQWTAVIDNAKDDAIPTDVVTWASGDQLRARVMWTKLKLRAAFPTTYAEVISPPTTLTGTNPQGQAWRVDWGTVQELAYNKQLADAGVSATDTLDEQAAVCLLMALSLGRRGATLDTGILGTAAVAPSTKPPLSMLIDGYGKPLGFYRFPWGGHDTTSVTLVTLAFGGTPLSDLQAVDPLDPQRRLMDPTWNNVANTNDITAFEQAIGHPIHDPNNSTWTPISYALWPVVVSGGHDLKLGLLPTTLALPGTMADDPAQPGARDDNIYSFRQ